MSEEFFQFIESPETATIRINTDAMNHLGALLKSVEDMVLRLAVLEMLSKHSKFVLETSEKIIMNKRLDIKAVK
tara:strand:- start:9221 stop:9442 length:222 start_codon:yes stop_codon:yes gene_type:complete